MLATLAPEYPLLRSFDAQFDSYRTYLSISPPGWGSGPGCYLITSSKIDVTDFTVQIPASVGPSASSYSLVTMEFNRDPYMDGPSGFEYSNNFKFTGGTGEWSEYELSGHSVGDPDSVPCSAYDCVRQCSQKYYQDNLVSDDSHKKTYECAAKCPGVSYDAIDSDCEGSDNSSSSKPSSTGSGFTQSTSLAASTVVSKSSPSSPSIAASTSSAAIATVTSTSSSSSWPIFRFINRRRSYRHWIHRRSQPNFSFNVHFASSWTCPFRRSNQGLNHIYCND